ncbi:DNA polymerase III subunit beta [Bifidobacterium myosotis]|uniref:DNA polymerase III subunit beta n=1 Tax=Bifidobacterium myosotis TaxID=1630166 RepID=A0A5M9ZHA4_9BIFI|nr:DNA polymerase III subunit beta [Bifidobacterium myosotis]KAA8826997.1 DNA polymerase III subunit beta [Bifidobacterium myosotis]
MRALVDARELANAVAHAVRVLEKDDPGVSLSADGERVAVTAAGDSQWSRSTLDAEILEPGDVVVNGLWLASLAQAMPSGEISVETDGPNLQLRGGQATLRMRLASEELRPENPAMPDSFTDVDPAEYEALCRSVVNAAGATRDRPVLAAVRFRGADGVLEAAATNRFMAGRRSMDAAVPDGEWLADADWVKRNARSITSIGFTGRHMVVRTAYDTDMIALVDGQYPRIDGFWWDTAEATGSIGVDRKALTEAARMLKSVCFDTSSSTVPLILDEHDGLLRVSYAGTGRDSDSAGVRALEAEISGEARMKVNADYLLAALGAMDADTVVIRKREGSDGRVGPYLIGQEDGRVDQLIMPVRG